MRITPKICGRWGSAIVVPVITACTMWVALLPTASGAASWEALEESWTIDTKKGAIEAQVKGRLSGKRGEVLILLRAPAVLTAFNAEGLVLRKSPGPKGAIDYTVAFPASSDPLPSDAVLSQEIAFSYQLVIPELKNGVPVPTAGAALHQITAIVVDQADWEMVVPTAAKISRQGHATTVNLVPAAIHLISLQPKKRDPASEKTEFFAESQQLYLPSPGVIDGRHHFEIRPSKGLVRSLRFHIPLGFTVAEVLGPVASWQFDPEKASLVAEMDPPQSGNFTLTVQTQGALPAFPAEARLAPLFVEQAAGQTGIIGLAFGEDAKPESITPENLTPVNLDDFDAGLVQDTGAVLHRAFRFKEGAGWLLARVAEVAPEVRVTTNQVLSLGDENLLLNINFAAEISRAGIFQLSFTVPALFEVSSLSGEGMQNWSEIVDPGTGMRNVTIHLNGKTLGRREFSLSLTSVPPARDVTWTLPRFAVNEANRQTGEIIVQPATGIRLSLAERRNVSEVDPRDLGARETGALAFRLLQKDWAVGLDLETLAPRLTGDVLHDVTLREARLRTAVYGRFLVENAAIRSLQIQLPAIDDDTAKTLRASGSAVREMVKVEGQANLWEIRLKRWLSGDLDLQIEWEKRASPGDGEFIQAPVTFPEARQLRYYFAARPTGRIETVLSEKEQSWRRIDWNTVPKSLRESSNRLAPSLALKAQGTPGDIFLNLERQSLADALKLRMSRGTFLTVLSPYGTRLTSANLDIEVIQRSYLTMTLPPESDLFCLFVNGETVPPVKKDATTWQFPVLPDTNGRQAHVFALYLEPGKTTGTIAMTAPLFNIPVENITWDILSPTGVTMTSHRGNLTYIDHEELGIWDRSNYLEIAKNRRQQQAEEAVTLLEKANQLVQSGQQNLAQQALKNVANRSGLDAASNEDARVQLETLQTRQALVGLNTRRQRMYLDRSPEEASGSGGEQLRESAGKNPVIQVGDLNFRPGDISQLLQGNSTAELTAFRKIAQRIVQQQQGEEQPAPGLDIAPPYEGNRYRFERGVQVTENAPLELKLGFAAVDQVAGWRWIAVVALILVVALAAVFGRHPKW